MRTQLDHVILAGPDLEELVEYAEAQLGVRAQPGGAHPGIGTRNALIGLGGQRYLELVAPDPDQPEPAQPRPFRVDELSQPTLTGWALRASGLAERVARAREHGVPVGEPFAMSRTRPDGTSLSWELTGFDTGLDGMVPFLIDWGSSPHPSQGLPGVKLVSLRIRHPKASELSDALHVLEAPRDIQLRSDQQVRLSLVIATSEGSVTLG